MNNYLALKKMSNTKFRRYTGITRFVFDFCVLLIEAYIKETKLKEGRPSNLSIEDQVLMLLEYYRENRTFFHLGSSYGLNESNVYRTIVKLESILLNSSYFRLNGKKALLDDKKIKSIMVDVTETPAQRPKKKSVISKILSVLPNKNENIAAKRSVIRTKYNLS